MEGHFLQRNSAFCSVKGLSPQALNITQLLGPLISTEKNIYTFNKLCYFFMTSAAMYSLGGWQKQPKIAVERLFLMLSMTFETHQERNNKDNLGNSAKRHGIKTTSAQYSRLTAKRRDSTLPRDYWCNTTVIEIFKRNENGIEHSYILG
jgi:hypothetical protein